LNKILIPYKIKFRTWAIVTRKFSGRLLGSCIIHPVVTQKQSASGRLVQPDCNNHYTWDAPATSYVAAFPIRS